MYKREYLRNEKRHIPREKSVNYCMLLLLSMMNFDTLSQSLLQGKCMLVVVDTGCETYLYNLQSVIITILAVVAVIILCVGKHVSLLCIAVM